MSVYLIVEAIEVFNQAKYSDYIQKVPKVIEKFGGQYRVRGGAVRVLSGDWNPSRLIVVEFESKEKFDAWWNSPEYRAIAPLREEGAKTNAVVVEGLLP